MNTKTSKSFVIKKTAQISLWILVSRVLGIVREVLQGQFLGVSAVSDAFFTAFRIPNLLRKIFEDGGISTALVPYLVKIIHDGGKRRASELLSAVFLIFEFIMLLCCVGVWLFPDSVTYFVAPGFSLEQVAATIPLLKIMFPVVIFFSSCNIVASALHAQNHFLVPSMGPAIFNLTYLAVLWLAFSWNLTVNALAWGIVLAGFVKFLSRLITYYWYGFSLMFPSRECLHDLRVVMLRFIPCLVSFGALEIMQFFDIRLTSYLPKGSVSLLYYAQRFLMLPYSILGVALATVLLSHFSLAALKNPKRMSFLLVESSKMAMWFALPMMALMMFLAKPLFADVMLKGRATFDEINTAAMLLVCLLCAFPFQVLNKIMISIFYAKNDTTSPMWIVIGATLFGTAFNYACIGQLGIYVMALGTLLYTVIKTCVLTLLLHRKHGVVWPFYRFFSFLQLYLLQFLFGVCIFGFLYATLWQLVAKMSVRAFFCAGAVGYWVLILSCFSLTLSFLWLTHRKFGLRLYLMPHHTD